MESRRPLLSGMELDVDDVSERLERPYPASGLRGRLGRLSDTHGYERVNLAATYLAVFAQPVVASRLRRCSPGG